MVMNFISDHSHGLVLDDSKNMYPSCLYAYRGGGLAFEVEYNTVMGVVTEGEVCLERGGQPDFTLRAGYYFSCSGPLKVSGKGQASLFERKGYRGLFQIGGPAEDHGRLVYIDNCRATILVAPARCGDPVLNLLTFPANIKQSMHIHPTFRMGSVLSGSGTCLFGDGKKAALAKGNIFYLPEATPHCFYSGENGLRVVAFHPDSDVGPTDSSHPMLSRTYVQR
jgi:quercetin dioxygenase-like cupin family protein